MWRIGLRPYLPEAEETAFRKGSEIRNDDYLVPHVEH
jgi:hypothetical protein